MDGYFRDSSASNSREIVSHFTANLYIYLLLSVIAFLLPGCTDTTSPLTDEDDNGEPVTYTVSGVVSDRYGEGVQGVDLTFGDFGTVTTGQDGGWSMSGLEGKVVITARRHGWFLQPDSITVESEATDLEFTATPSEIAFVSNRGGDDSDGFFSIYVMNADGSNVTRLANTGRGNMAPAWSPDGRRIAFQSFDGLQEDIYVMNADGSGITRLTDSGADDMSPTWSPDGSQIAFISYRDGNPRIYLMNADGTDQNWIAALFNYRFPDWSRVENHIVYSTPSTNAIILRMLRWKNTLWVDRPIEFDSWLDYDDITPAWSLDGSIIAFHRVSSGIWSIDVVVSEDLRSVDVSNLRQITVDDDFARSPAWTPDGRIIYESGQQIYVIDVDGTNRIQLTDTVEPNLDPIWSPRW